MSHRSRLDVCAKQAQTLVERRSHRGLAEPFFAQGRGHLSPELTQGGRRGSKQHALGQKIKQLELSRPLGPCAKRLGGDSDAAVGPTARRRSSSPQPHHAARHVAPRRAEVDGRDGAAEEAHGCRRSLRRDSAGVNGANACSNLLKNSC